MGLILPLFHLSDVYRSFEEDIQFYSELELLNDLSAQPRVSSSDQNPWSKLQNLHSRVSPIYSFPIGIILVHYTRYFCRVFNPR